MLESQASVIDDIAISATDTKPGEEPWIKRWLLPLPAPHVHAWQVEHAEDVHGEAVDGTLVRPMGYVESAVIYILAAAALVLVAWYLSVWLNSAWAVPAMLAWFTAGALIFVPMFILAIVLVRHEGFRSQKAMAHRMMLARPLSRPDLLPLLAALTLTGVLTILSIGLALLIDPSFKLEAPFDTGGHLAPSQRWYLLVWLPFFFFNIVGEELWWRGYMWRRQQARFHRYTWVVSGAGWMFFHLAFGAVNIGSWPIIFVQSWAVQRYQSTWFGIAFHGILNGGGFLAVVFGLVPT